MKSMFMARMILLLALGVFGLGACATSYTHPTKATRDFERDKRDCERSAEKTVAKKGVPLCEEVKKCLETQKGWRPSRW